MNSPRKPNSSYFGPRRHTSTRLKVANGLSLRKSEGRFRSKPLMKIDKECRKHQADMKCMSLSKGNQNAYDLRVNVVIERANTVPPNNSNTGSSSALVAKNSKSGYALASKRASQPTALRLESSLNPSSNFKCSKPSIVRNALPLKIPKVFASCKSKDDSNTISRHLEQSHNIKTPGAISCRTHLKAMPNLVHKSKNVATSNINNGALGLRRRSESNSYKEDINVCKEGTKTSELLKIREVTRKSNIPVVNWMDPSKDESNKEKGSQDKVVAKEGINGRTCGGRAACSNRHKQTVTTKINDAPNIRNRMNPSKDESNKEKGRQDKVVTKEVGMKGRTCGGRATCSNRHKQTITTKINDAPNISSSLDGKKDMQGLESNLRDNSSHLFAKNHSGHQRDDPFMEVDNGAIFSSKHVFSCEYRETNLKLPNGVQSVGGNEITNDIISRRGKRQLLEEKASTHGQKDLTCRPMKRRRYIESNEDEEDDVGDQHPVHIEDVTTELTPQVSISKLCVEQQCYCCSKPIDIPRWSGIFKIDGKEYLSLAGHLSSKSCEKVWELSSLPNVVEVTKVPRMAVWPKIFKASKPTADNIGLYFFPPELRHDEELDELVNEVMDNDLILRAVIDEAEMLVFPSVLLPERYQTFQKKHYLWAAFKAKEDKGDVSSQLDEVQSEEPDQEMTLTKSAMLLENQQFPAKSIQEVEGCCVQRSTNMWLEHESPEERRLRDSSHRAVCTTATSTAVANAATVPTKATSFTTDNASSPANHGDIRPSMEVPNQSSSVFGIVVRQAPNLELEVKQFVQEMERKGALVTVMRGEAIGGGSWSSNGTTSMH